MPRKSQSAFLILILIVVILVVGSWFFWVNQPLGPPGLTSRAQITHDGLVKSIWLLMARSCISRRFLGRIHSFQKFPQLVVTFPNSCHSSECPVAGCLCCPFFLAGSGKHGWTIDKLSLLDVSTAGGPAKRFGDLSGQEAVWAPDGQHVLLVKGSSLYVTTANGAPPKELVRVEGTPYYPRYSPDGKRVRFSVGDIAQSTSSIWEMNSDGTGLHALLPDWNDVSSKCCGSWTADGRYYIFQATETALGSNGNLFALAESAGRFRQKRSQKPCQTHGRSSLILASGTCTR